MPARDYRDLIVWQKAMRLAVACYRVTHNFPPAELHGLTGQIRRASVSIPANIAEGQGRSSKKDFQRHLSIARGSLNELQTLLMLARRITYLAAEDETSLIQATHEISKMLTQLRRSLTSNQKSPSNARTPAPTDY
jgi:four helix bundle protein